MSFIFCAFVESAGRTPRQPLDTQVVQQMQLPGTGLEKTAHLVLLVWRRLPGTGCMEFYTSPTCTEPEPLVFHVYFFLEGFLNLTTQGPHLFLALEMKCLRCSHRTDPRD